MPPFRRSLPMLLNTALDQVMPVYRELFARFDLTEQQWRVLRVLWNAEKITAREVAERTLLPSPSLVGILDRLEKKNLVARVRSIEDRRNVHIVATAKGRELSREVLPQVEKIQTCIKNSVSAEDWQQMEGTMAHIGQQMSSVTLDDILNPNEASQAQTIRSSA